MKYYDQKISCFKIAASILIISLLLSMAVIADPGKEPKYAGSSSCLECHEKFYKLWSSSRHGLAMQPYTTDFAEKQLAPQKTGIVINGNNYLSDLKNGEVTENGPKGKKNYKIEHVLGGKNVYYFLTLLDKGRLQTLPIAYDVNKKEWFDTVASGIRHFPGGEQGQSINWKEYQYTFNTACYGCHVSQLSTNYDLLSDTYHTTWAEPGINCETCHGSSIEHNKIAKAAPVGQPLPDSKIISTKTMTKTQRNDLCSGCHAKASPLTIESKPGEKFYDHFDLVTLEDPDFYPDGRDLGENYTLTSWSMSPCFKSGKIDCMHCHTSSGRYRFKKEKFNDACMPCHEDKIKDPAAHTHHAADGEGSKCISCHMPMTSFARMNRSDHSMLPPTPASTVAYKSPNACNLCHADKDAAWADKTVRKWRTHDYQAPVLKRAALIDAARKRDWKKLPEMLSYINDPKHDEIFATSLIRLIQPVQDQNVLYALLSAAKDPSPLVRGAAVQALGLMPTTESLQALIVASKDEYRLVRVRAAAGIASFPKKSVPVAYESQLKKANNEYIASITARPDQWTSHYNMGNYLLDQGDAKKAVASYQTALQLDPQVIMPMVNTSMAYAQMGENNKAEASLYKALKLSPDNAAANFNMGLLKAEKKELKEAEEYMKKAFDADPNMAQAAYSLCIITAKDRIDEAVDWCRKASELRPHDPKYAYTLAFYLNQKGDKEASIKTLNRILKEYPQHKDAEMLLKEISKQYPRQQGKEQ
ncbi:HEAT repeat domain-containing protein [Desulforegula conservatrix]|uniref:HEAT repeat domain-containing protein n=1 Tax=Desulforegula conservatrix TaxID=153026 RepID=UPI0004852796|nr:HEAT repeat domain-containing protein [Desulforegula conservatrix]